MNTQENRWSTVAPGKVYRDLRERNERRARVARLLKARRERPVARAIEARYERRVHHR